MRYRNIILEFLANYREYRFDCFQLLLFENHHQNNILKVIADSNFIDVYQVKQTQVFHKKVTFSSINNTTANLLFISEEPQILEISKLNMDLKQTLDLYNLKPIFDLNHKYLIIYPIYYQKELLGGFFIYSNYQTLWQLEEHKIINFLNALENASCQDVIDEISKNVDSLYWTFTNKGVYLSKELSDLLNKEQYNNSFNKEGKSLKELSKKECLNGVLNSYQVIFNKPIESFLELINKKITKFSLIYIRTLNDESLVELYSQLKELIKKIDGCLGEYTIYQTSNNSLSVLFEMELNKKIIEDYFKEFSYILVRSTYEIKKITDFSHLLNYLNLSPIEEFKYEYYQYYLSNILNEKKRQVITNYSNFKIKVTPLMESRSMKLNGYLLKCLYDLKNASKDNKLKSIKEILKIGEEYVDKKIYLDLNITDFFNGENPYIAYINVLKKFINEHEGLVTIVVDFDQEKFLRISSLWPDFEKHVFIDYRDEHFMTIINYLDTVKGLSLINSEYAFLLKNHQQNAVTLSEYLMKYCNMLLVKVKQNDIIKYSNKNIIFVCE